jgi:hypothetical protein
MTAAIWELRNAQGSRPRIRHLERDAGSTNSGDALSQYQQIRRHRDQVDVVRAADATSRERSGDLFPSPRRRWLPATSSLVRSIDAVVAGLRSRGAELVGELT